MAQAAKDREPLAQRYLRPEQAAEYLGYSRRTIYDLIPQIKHYRVGSAGAIRFLREDLDAFMQGQAVQPVRALRGLT